MKIHITELHATYVTLQCLYYNVTVHIIISLYLLSDTYFFIVVNITHLCIVQCERNNINVCMYDLY